MRNLVSRFRRKFWRKVLRLTLKRLPAADALEVLDPLWWELVRFRLKEIAATDLGLNTVRLILGEGEHGGREVRDSRYR
jgi:hypothetical protein